MGAGHRDEPAGPAPPEIIDGSAPGSSDRDEDRTLMKIILANPRGFCAGVNMAIECLERALEFFGPPLYVYHEIVHNKFVVERVPAAGHGLRRVARGGPRGFAPALQRPRRLAADPGPGAPAGSWPSTPPVRW